MPVMSIMLLAMLFAGAAVASAAPLPPVNVTATAADGVNFVTQLSWERVGDPPVPITYRIWRSTQEDGRYFLIGSTSDTRFGDMSSSEGQTYFYRVSAIDITGESTSGPVGAITATTTISPHGNRRVDSFTCIACHSVGEAATEGRLSRNADDEFGQAATCFACHTGVGSSKNVRTGQQDSFALSSGHRLEDGNLTGTCASCHGIHADRSSNSKLTQRSINGTTVSDNTQWCLACHRKAEDWFTGTYPSPSAPSRNASGYPTAGTFPGAATYFAAGNPHASIPASTTTGRVQGDCLNCHTAHRGPSSYDGLRAQLRPTSPSTLASDQANGDYAAACFRCHSPSAEGGSATDIKSFATAPTGGHRIRTAGGNLPVGSPLPCYDCHNAHGSTRNNSSLIADTLGENLDTSTDEGTRRFCFTCHTTSDGNQGWDSTSGSYQPVTGTDQVEGLPRTGGVLALPDSTPHRSASTQSCSACHGGSYANGGGNVHGPTGGANAVSSGGQPCSDCHQTVSSSPYHHVLGTATQSADATFAAGSYPTAGNDVFCLSCHVDHSMFSADPGSNLRSDMTSAPAASNTDFNTTTNGGVCVGCHSVARTRDTSGQASGGTTVTPAISGADYNASAHQYAVSGAFGASQVKADCVKCHNAGTTQFQTGAFKFSLHGGIERRLLDGVAATVTAGVTAEEQVCFKCHSGSGPGKDVYGVATMTAGPRGIRSAFESTGSVHGVSNQTGVHRGDEDPAMAPRHVECEDCHNTHAARSGVRATGTPDAGPELHGATGVRPNWTTVNGSAPASHTAITFNGTAGQSEAYVCFKCHSRTLNQSAWPTGTVTTKSGTYTPTDIARWFNPNNRSGHNAVEGATWPRTTYGAASWPLPANTSSWLNPGYTASSKMTCTDCHSSSSTSAARGPHGTSGKWLIDGQYGAYDQAYLSPTGVVGNPVCMKCHPTDLQTANYAHSRGNHQNANEGKCVNCHVGTPHGSQFVRMLRVLPATTTATYGFIAEPTVQPSRKTDCSTTPGCH